MHILPCKNISVQPRVFLEDRFLKVASLGQEYTHFKFLQLVLIFPPKRRCQFTLPPSKDECAHSFTSLPLGIM